MRITLMILILTATASADPVVLAVDGKDIYIDLGAKDGVGAGSELELLHEIVAKDPTTGKALHDRFALGTMTVAKSGDGISVAHTDADLAKRVLVGDHVRLVSAKKAFVDPWEEQVAASKASAPAVVVKGAPIVDHAALARDAWQQTLGQPPEARIARWRDLLTADPTTPYRTAIQLEIKSLLSQAAARDSAVARARSSNVDERSPRIAQLAAQLESPAASGGAASGGNDSVLEVAPIDRAVPGRPIELAFLVRAPQQVAKGWLYVRPQGDVGFKRSELVRDGDAYLRGTIDGQLVRDPGLEWYVEVAAPGKAGSAPALGTHTAPLAIEIDRVVTEAPIARHRSQIDLHLDYVDFDGGFSKGYDQYYQAEADFTYRFIHPIYAVRLGFGTLDGIGGPKAVIDHDPNQMCLDTNGQYQCKRITFSYVYTEYEYRIRPNVAVMLRPTIGVLSTDIMPGADAHRCQSRDTAGCQFFTGIGGRARLRLGEEFGTNLILGASFTRDVGTLLEAAYHWLPAPVVPVQVTVQVTDQPVIDDFGVRLVGDVGYKQPNSWFYPSARVSYQARALNHTGVSGGMALNFDW
jgi:hypothetical protein